MVVYQVNLSQYSSNLFSNEKKINLFQPTRSTSFNLDQFGVGEKHRLQATSDRSLLASTGSILNIH